MTRLRIKIVATFMCVSLGAASWCGMKVSAVSEHSENEHVILFVSDIHGKVKENLEPFLQRYNETVDGTEFVCFGGDYENRYSEETIRQVVNLKNSKLPEAQALYTVGNHDLNGFKCDSFYRITKQKARGRMIRKPGYLIYTFGASSEKQAFSEKDMQELKEFLESTKQIIPRVPVFIVSHYPIHYCENKGEKRVTTGAKKLIELLNGYSNVVFLYGHNHTMEDVNYTLVNMPGDEIEIDKDKEETINFCYTSMGAMEDGAGHEIYALKATIKNTTCCNQVTLEHLNFDSEPTDKMMVCFPLVEVKTQ